MSLTEGRSSVYFNYGMWAD